MIIDPDTSNIFLIVFIFLVWRITTLPNIENADNFSQNLKAPKKLVEVPQVGDSISAPASHHFEAPGHRWSWRPPRHLLRAKAPQPRLCPSMPPSGAASRLRRFSRAATAKMPTARETTKVVGMLSSVPVQPTNER